MIKWFVYIVLLLILIPCLSSAKIRISSHRSVIIKHYLSPDSSIGFPLDTVPNKKKIKEVAKAKPLPKPEKVDDAADANSRKAKPKRQRRPPGLERPPEIPRRNGN